MTRKQQLRRRRMIRRRVLPVVFILIILLLLFFVVKGIRGCGKKKNTAEPASSQSSADASTQTSTESAINTALSSAVSQLIASGDAKIKEETATSVAIENTPIDNVDALDGTNIDWGSGGAVDEYNRPAGCLQYQEKYGSSYPAYFIANVDEPEKKVIYLTFDEGYENGYTPAILDTLKEKDVKAVFFCTLPFFKEQPELVQRMIDEGHELGNHSVNHPSAGLPSESVEEQTNEIMEVHNYVVENFDYTMHLFRFPAGKFSERSLAIVNNCNYRAAFWSFAHYDYNTEDQPDVATSLQKAVDSLHPGAIYLLHAVSSTNTEMLGDFIDQAKAAGYEFELLQ